MSLNLNAAVGAGLAPSAQAPSQVAAAQQALLPTSGFGGDSISQQQSPMQLLGDILKDLGSLVQEMGGSSGAGAAGGGPQPLQAQGQSAAPSFAGNAGANSASAFGGGNPLQSVAEILDGIGGLLSAMGSQQGSFGSGSGGGLLPGLGLGSGHAHNGLTDQAAAFADQQIGQLYNNQQTGETAAFNQYFPEFKTG